MSVLLLTMGPQLGITAELPVVGVGGAGVIRFRAIGASGLVKWTLVDSTLPAEWDSALNPDGDAVTLTTSDAETAGAFRVTVRAVDNARIPVVRSFDVRVMTLPLTISGAFPAWGTGLPATGALTITGGVPPYSGLSITSGALPAGVSLSIVGNQIVPSGAPTVAGPWSATVQVSDSLSTPASIVASGDVAVPTDPYWEHVVALLHFDGPDGSTTFTDETGKSWVPGGNAQIDTAQSKFGGASGLFDGTGDYISTGTSADFDFGSGDFTVEFFVRLNDMSNQVFIGRRNAAGFTPFGVGVFASKLQMLVSTSGASWASTARDSVDFVSGAWTHVALVRSGTNFTLYKNGNSVVSSTISGSVMSSTNPVLIGAWDSTLFPTNGHIDEVRITKGVARYTANFTPPDRAFPDQ